MDIFLKHTPIKNHEEIENRNRSITSAEIEAAIKKDLPTKKSSEPDDFWNKIPVTNSLFHVLLRGNTQTKIDLSMFSDFWSIVIITLYRMLKWFHRWSAGVYSSTFWVLLTWHCFFSFWYNMIHVHLVYFLPQTWD